MSNQSGHDRKGFYYSLDIIKVMTGVLRECCKSEFQAKYRLVVNVSSCYITLELREIHECQERYQVT